MHYCCPNCRHWTQIEEEFTQAERCCNFCFAPIRVASGLITQIAAQHSEVDKEKLRGAEAWPPVARKFLQHLHHEVAKSTRNQRHWLARWAGPLSCAAILMVFGFVAQTYLGHRSAMAESSASAPAEASVVVPPLILEHDDTTKLNESPINTNEHK